MILAKDSVLQVLSVELTTVKVGQKEWTVVQMMVSKIFGNDPRQYMDLILQSTQ